MALILADTDVLIDYLAGIEPIREQVARAIAADRLWTTSITCFELLSGPQDGRRGQALQRFVEALTVLPLDRVAASNAAGVRRHLESAGRTIGMADSLIAGIALSHDLPLLTRNRSHFDRVPGLRLEQPLLRS